MDLVFSTDSYAPAERYAAWRDAICDVYVHVDVKATDPERLSRLHPRGEVRRGRDDRHPAVGAAHPAQQPAHLPARQGMLLPAAHPHGQRQRRAARRHASVQRRARRHLLRRRSSTSFTCHGEVRSFYLEIPARRIRAALPARADSGVGVAQHDAGPRAHRDRILRDAGDRGIDSWTTACAPASATS